MRIDIINENQCWSELSPEEKKKELYLRQKRILDDFLERGAITQAQYDKSFGDLTEKMGMGEVLRNCKAAQKSNV